MNDDAVSRDRFVFTLPRNFVLLGVLLLVSEMPGYGYELTKRLRALHLGALDRPGVYRALARLERDGLVLSRLERSRVAQGRRVYRATDDGLDALLVWMAVVQQERDALACVLHRYDARMEALTGVQLT